MKLSTQLSLLATIAGIGLFPIPTKAATIDSIVQVDALGYECIPEASLEDAFASTGKKGIVLPQTCLPNPCLRLDRKEFDSLLGYISKDEEWSRYISRRSDYCVAETRGVWNKPNESSFPVSKTGFWSPLISSPIFASLILSVQTRSPNQDQLNRNGINSISRSTRYTSIDGSTENNITNTSIVVNKIVNVLDYDNPIPTIPQEPTQPSSIPIPASISLMLLVLLSFSLLNLRYRKTSHFKRRVKA